MKNLLLTTLFAIIMAFISVTANAQNNWTFVMIETTVSNESIPTSDENPTERRFYISNVIESPNNLRSYQLPKIADEYFMVNVIDPLKVKGIKHEYYENNVRMDCGSVVSAKDRKDAEAKRVKCIEDTQEQGRVNIYSFNWTFTNAKGLETAQPMLIFRGKETPNYQPKGATDPTNVTRATTESDTKPKSKKAKKNNF